jgi:hypothetical protein
MSEENVKNITNVTNKVTSVTTVTNITNVTNVSPVPPATKVPQVPQVPSEFVSDKDYQNMLDILSNCKCCKIHAINRPSIYKPFVEVPYRIDVPDRPSNTLIDINGDAKIICDCDCRINARMICRNHPEYTT